MLFTDPPYGPVPGQERDRLARGGFRPGEHYVMQGATSGRLSCTTPNRMDIPDPNKRIRRAGQHVDPYIFLEVDYASLEPKMPTQKPIVLPGCACATCNPPQCAGDGCTCGMCFMCQYVISHECYSEPGWATCTECDWPNDPEDPFPQRSVFRSAGEGLYIYQPDGVEHACASAPLYTQPDPDDIIPFDLPCDPRMFNTVHDSIIFTLTQEGCERMVGAVEMLCAKVRPEKAGFIFPIGLRGGDIT